MTLESLRDAERVIGVKQVTKAVQKSRADAVFLADDADERVTQPLLDLAAPLRQLYSRAMPQVGKCFACRKASGSKSCGGVIINNKFSI